MPSNSSTEATPNWVWLIPILLLSLFLLYAVGQLMCIGRIESFLVSLPILLLVITPGLWTTLVEPSRVTCDKEGHSLRLTSLVGATKLIPLGTLTGYSGLLLMRSSRRNLVLYVGDGRHIQLTGFTLRGVPLIEQFLLNSGVQWLGDELNLFFPLNKTKYRFDPK
jgi:hypothetical protein